MRLVNYIYLYISAFPDLHLSISNSKDSNASRALEIGLPVTAAVLLLLGFAAVFYFRYYRRWRGDRNEHSRDFVTMNDVVSVLSKLSYTIILK